MRRAKVKGKGKREKAGPKEGLWDAEGDPGVVAYSHDPRHPSQVEAASGWASTITSVPWAVVSLGGRQLWKGGDRGGREGNGRGRGKVRAAKTTAASLS